ncbi:MAG: hypothetical protein NXI07_02235 [bacterium]|nr:hypothetical protein [bacterium]
MKLAYCLGVSIVTAATAAPVVYQVPGAEDRDVTMSDIDPLLPPVNMYLESAHHGGGSQTVTYRPVVVEAGTFCFDVPPGNIEVEVANVNPGSGQGYSTPIGTTIDSLTSNWVYTEPLCDVGSILDGLYVTRGDGCYTCDQESSNYDDGSLRFIPIRWRDAGTTPWHYGWIAFTQNRMLNPDPSCENICFPEDLYVEVFDVVAFGLETDSDTGIIAGGGICEADLNFDAQRDFFDVSEFLSRYANGDLSVDFDDSGTLDFFDVSAFLTAFSADCLP